MPKRLIVGSFPLGLLGVMFSKVEPSQCPPTTREQKLVDLVYTWVCGNQMVLDSEVILTRENID